MKNGDILALSGGHLAMVLETFFPTKEMCQIQLAEVDEPTLVDMKELIKDSVNYGADRCVAVPFLAARSIHLRLNKINKV